jgi:mannosyltransferase B
MKKISLELQWAIGKKTGVGWYIYNIVRELNKSKKNKYIAEFINFFGKYNVRKEIDCDIKIRENKLMPYKVYDFLTKKIKISHNLIFGTKSDIYHFFNFTIPKNIKGKVINTIYDTVFISAPETMGDRKEIEEYKYGAKKSDLIITISESAKKDIINHLQVPEDKIRIVYPGIDLEKYSKIIEKKELKKIREKYKLPEKYILYLGTIEPRKNIERIVKSFLEYKNLFKSNIKLVLAGGKGWKYDKIMELVEQNKDKIILTGYVEEEDKVLLYKMSEIFVFPSLYEGFGMPVLEAMACEIPVITSNVSSLPEVAGEAGVLVDPLNEKEMVEAYDRILSDENLKREMIKKGIEQSKKFQWKESAKKLEKIYEEL